MPLYDRRPPIHTHTHTNQPLAATLLLPSTTQGKKEIRKLYVAAARVYPEDCLQLMSASLSALPTPLSSAPFPPTEAALKLVLAFGDCGVQNASHVKEGLFPQLLKALHDSDIGSHAHAQVRLNYFELSARYARQSTVESIGRVAHVLIGAHGMRCADAQVRCRAAYFFLKVVECAGENASKLLPIVGSFAGTHVRIQHPPTYLSASIDRTLPI